MPHSTPKAMNTQGLCIQEMGLSSNLNSIGHRPAVALFKEQPRLQTMSECANIGGFAWWLLEQDDAPGFEPCFFQLSEDIVPLQGLSTTKGKCVDHIECASLPTYVPMCMFSSCHTHSPQSKVQRGTSV
jgi:hypothetical protein